MKKTGIFGGTFSPIHVGHLMLAERAFSDFELDEILLIPTGLSHLKDNTVIDKKHRLAMTRAAIAGNDHFSVSTIEVDRPGNSYTYETLTALKEANPDVNYFFIIGADSLFQLETWVKPDIILASATIIVAARDDVSVEDLNKKADEYKLKYDADIRILNFPQIDISSTEIRRRVKDGKSIKYMVTDSVIDYITENGLYK